MAGSIASLQLAQQMDVNGRPLVGALLYLYAAGTSTPANSFQDFNLSLALPFPIEADATGRLPVFWVADGSYRARLTDANGILIFDLDGIEALGPSTGGATGGGSSIDATSVHQTGDMTWQPVTGAKSGWVRANGRTMGSASSGAAERANADTQPLYEFFWNNFSDTDCPVTGGRGGSAVADFGANKSIGIIDMRGYSVFGLDDMGASSAGRLTLGTPTTAFSSGGTESVTISLANLPANIPVNGATFTGTPLATHTHTYDRTTVNNTLPKTSGGSDVVQNLSLTSTPSGATSAGTPAGTIGGVANSAGANTAFSHMPPYRLGSWFCKL